MARRGGVAEALPDLVSGLLSKVASVAALGLGVTFIYFIYALLSGYVAAYPRLAATEPQQAWKVYGNLLWASRIFTLSAVALIAYTVLNLWEEHRFAGTMAIGGAVLYFGGPLGITQLLGGPAVRSYASNHAALQVQGALTTTGEGLLLAALIWGLPLLLLQLQTGFTGVGAESATRRAARKSGRGLVHPLSPCWQLPYCRPYIRDNCVRYQERTTCWRVKAGCMCDDDIMAAALISEGGTVSGARERLIQEFLPGAAGKGGGQRKIKCQNCFIYLEHQRVKHKYLAPLAFPGIAFLFWLLLDPIQRLYAGFGALVTQTIASVALGEVNTVMLQQTFANPMVKWLILLCAGMFALTYLLRFLEYLFFKLKI